MGIVHDIDIREGEGNPLDRHVEIAPVEIGSLRRAALGCELDLDPDLLE